MGQSSSAPARAPATAINRTQPDLQPPSECPMQTELNPLNQIPELPHGPSPGQIEDLSLQRTVSSIPMLAAGSPSASASSCPVSPKDKDASAPVKDEVDKWVYPSPQQFYNALVRKGWETPEEHIPMMVNIHNWLNERAWNEVLKWEVRHVNGERSSLARFQGRPGDLSPKARWNLFLGKLMPSRYNTTGPFDRHDWIVLRPNSSPSQPLIMQRYVIDYYALPEDSEGNPQFSLDVRPALDNWESIKLRLSEWRKNYWRTHFKRDQLPPAIS